MQKFKYTAVNIDKKKFSGTFLADNEDHLREQLAVQGLYLVSSKVVTGSSPNSFFSVSGKVKIAELTTFCRQFSIMINSGISIVDCIDVLKTQSYSSYFKQVLEIVYEDIKSGLLLSEAMKKHKKVFPDFFRNMVYVGEMSGSLDTVLTSISDYYDVDTRIRRKTKDAMIYPIILVVLLVGVLILLMVFVVPTFMDALDKLDVEMPEITMAIFNVSTFISTNWKEITLTIVGLAALFVLIGRTTKGRYAYDTIKLYLPIVSKVQINMATARFARSLGLLLQSGMDIVDAMEVISVIIGNKNLEKRFGVIAEEVKAGQNITTVMNKHKLFPQMLIQMISVGEKTGELDSVLLRSCSFFDNQVETSLSSITTILQPAMLAIMGGVIGVVFYAVYSPILSILTTLT